MTPATPAAPPRPLLATDPAPILNCYGLLQGCTTPGGVLLTPAQVLGILNSLSADLSLLTVHTRTRRYSTPSVWYQALRPHFDKRFLTIPTTTGNWQVLNHFSCDAVRILRETEAIPKTHAIAFTIPQGVCRTGDVARVIAVPTHWSQATTAQLSRISLPHWNVTSPYPDCFILRTTELSYRFLLRRPISPRTLAPHGSTSSGMTLLHVQASLGLGSRGAQSNV